MWAARLIAENLVLLPYALVPMPMAPPRRALTLSLGSALGDRMTIVEAGGAADGAGTWVLRAQQLRVLGGHVWANSDTVTAVRNGQAVGVASGPEGGWCIVAPRRPLLERLRTVQQEILKKASARPTGTEVPQAAPRTAALPRFGKRSSWF